MNYVWAKTTKETGFFGNTNPVELVEKYGSPLYVYNEMIFRQRCREMRDLVSYKNFVVNYSVKANTNISLLKIAKEEGLHVDVVSTGEIYICKKAGFKPEDIFYVSNNASAEELQYAINEGVLTSVDSITQLELFGKLNPGGEIAIRLNPGVGAGHHQKVITAGKKTKFGIELRFVDDVKEIVKKYNLKVVGINQHVGSLFMDGQSFIEAVEAVVEAAKQFEDLKFIDLGGGYGIPYKKQDGEKSIDLKELGERVDRRISKLVENYGRDIYFKIEPGRYISAECGVLLGSAYAVKTNYEYKYIGTDLGFNVLVRPVMYGSHHDIEIYRKSDQKSEKKETVRIVGNICETGDIIAKDRELPEIFEGDIIGVMDAGAYGFTMSSNYNSRLRPAEVLITKNGSDVLVRRRDTFEDLVKNYEL